MANADSLAAVSTIDAAARWLQAKDPMWRFREAAIRNGCPEPVVENLLRRPPDAILGTVVRDSLAYVVYQAPPPFRRSSYSPRGQTRIERPGLLVLRRSADQWRIATQDDLVLGQAGVAIGVSCSRTGRPPG